MQRLHDRFCAVRARFGMAARNDIAEFIGPAPGGRGLRERPAICQAIGVFEFGDCCLDRLDGSMLERNPRHFAAIARHRDQITGETNAAQVKSLIARALAAQQATSAKPNVDTTGAIGN